MKKPKRTVRIDYRPLGRERAHGQFIPVLNIIEIDPRLKGKKHLDVLIHEGTHFLLQYLEEDAVAKFATDMAEILWADGYRKPKETL